MSADVSSPKDSTSGRFPPTAGKTTITTSSSSSSNSKGNTSPSTSQQSKVSAGSAPSKSSKPPRGMSSQSSQSVQSARARSAKGAFTRAKTIVGLDVASVESSRLKQDEERVANWKRWGPYLSERQWATVREDYSPDGSWSVCK